MFSNFSSGIIFDRRTNLISSFEQVVIRIDDSDATYCLKHIGWYNMIFYCEQPRKNLGHANSKLDVIAFSIWSLKCEACNLL